MEALGSPLFKPIRDRQPHNENHLRPCMIIDNPEIAREIIRETKPRFTHPGAEEVYTRQAAELDAYAKDTPNSSIPLGERVSLRRRHGPGAHRREDLIGAANRRPLLTLSRFSCLL